MATNGHVAYDPDNIFAKIIDGKIPAYKVFENDSVLAILDAFPVRSFPVCTMLSPAA